MTTKRDYYEVLGVDKAADEATIKSAYRKKAMQYHPDRNQGNAEAEERFKEATEAYEVLKDSDKRRMYDQFGHAGMQGGGFNYGGGGFQGFDLSDALRAFMRDFGGGGGSIFDDLFDTGRRGQRSNQGEDLRIRFAVTLEEVASGIEKTIKVNRLLRCDTCAGSGVAAGSSRKQCPQCKGHGQVRTIQRTFLGTIQQVSTCNTCRGTGEIIADPCRSCGGEGRVRGSSNVKVKAPAGVASGNYMSIEAMGNAGPHGGHPGDLIVVFEELEHERFSRQGDNILLELPISFTTAALGGEVTVPTINGSETISVPAGTQSGKILKLKGKGIPHLHHSGRGDQLVQVTVWVPTKLSSEDKKLLQKLATSESFNAPKGDKSFFEKLRSTLGV